MADLSDFCGECATCAAPLPRASDTDAVLSARVAELRAWARARLGVCENSPEPLHTHEAAQRLQEARTLRAVLRVLDGDAP